MKMLTSAMKLLANSRQNDAVCEMAFDRLNLCCSASELRAGCGICICMHGNPIFHVKDHCGACTCTGHFGPSKLACYRYCGTCACRPRTCSRYDHTVIVDSSVVINVPTDMYSHSFVSSPAFRCWLSHFSDPPCNMHMLTVLRTQDGRTRPTAAAQQSQTRCGFLLS